MINLQPAWQRGPPQERHKASIEWDLEQVFVSRSTQLNAYRGREIVTAGVTCKHVFQLKSGLACRQRPLRDGRQAILDLYLPGDFIELDSLFFAPSLDTVLALTNVSYWALDHAALNGLMQKPRVALQLMRHMAEEKQRLDTIAILLGRLKARERTATLLLALSRRMNPPSGTAATGENEDRASLPLTQKQLADYLGLDLIHTNRTLGALRNSGAVRCRKGAIVIMDVTQLEQIAEALDRSYRIESAPGNKSPGTQLSGQRGIKKPPRLGKANHTPPYDA
jgi:CRP/FNR family transcriptional regulator, anaerobic regulatory protein